VKGFTLPIFNYYHEGMQVGQSIPVIGDFLRLTFIENPGMAFGIDFGNPLFRSIFTLIVSIGIFYYIYLVRKEPFIVRLTLAVILGGAIGNLIDRIFYGAIFGEGPVFYGKVVDFIDMDFFHIDFLWIHMDRFAVFNIADFSVSTGIVLMMLFYRKFTKSEGSDSSQVSSNQNTDLEVEAKEDSNQNSPADSA
jgi:signal peptidase II